MIKVICGMIGSGKTTYAIENKKSDDVLLDFDILKETFKINNPKLIKELQDDLLIYFSKKGYSIWYVTTFIGSKEYELLEKIGNIEFIWINTTENQCIKNIIKRNRSNELKELDNLIAKNKKIYNNYYINSNNIKYNIIETFNSDERW